MSLLEDLKIQIQEITKDIAKSDTLIYILIPTAIFLFLILVGIGIYELINRFKNKEIKLMEENKNHYINQINISFI